MKPKKAASKSTKATATRKSGQRVVSPVGTQVQAFSLEPVFAALRKRYPAARQAEAQAFAGDFYRRMEADEFPHHTAEEWAAIAGDTLEFARVRKPGTASVRVFNPTLKANGWETPHTVLQIVNDDMPFLVDSVSMALADMGVGVHVLGHPVLHFSRDRAGKLGAVGEGRAESLMVLEIDRQPAEEMQKIEAAIRKVLGEVRAIVGDWSAMREKMVALADELSSRRLPVDDESRHEAQEFLRWAAADHFTFFGYREYRVEKQGGEEVLAPVEASGMGLMRGKDKSPARPVKSLAAHGLSAAGAQKDALILTKTNARSRVHRAGYMDYIGVLEYDAKGRIVAEQRFLGLFTSSAYNRRPWEIPLVRRRHDYVMEKSGLAPSSHSGKALRHILETLPREELFQSNEEELFRTAMGILGLQERVRSRLFLRRDKYSRFISALVYLPRDRFNTDVRLRIEALLKDALHGEYIDSTVVLGESPLAQLHLIVRPKAGEALEFDTSELEQRLAHLLRNWQDDLREALVARHGEADGLRMASAYGRALPAGYIEESTTEAAASDVEHLAALQGPDDLHLSLQAVRREGRDGLRLKLYRQLDDIPLSDALPMMENLGLRVISERPYRLQVGDAPVYIQDFEVESTAGQIDAAAADTAFGEAFARIWHGDAENDGFNRLILSAGLHWRQVAMLRGYCKYLLQTGVPFSQSYVEQTFQHYPLLARLLVELFEARFDPSTGSESKAEIAEGQARLKAALEVLAAGDEATIKALQVVVGARKADRAAQQEATRATLLKLMDRVSSLDEDRILRSFMGVIDATLRTSYYQTDAAGEHGHCISFKFDSSKVPDLPKPRPYREIFVYGPRVEGVHLRFGAVARGGLRWSDRREDFRTEVLGLVKAQMVKNTVIVPVGAKGGFFCKRPPAGGDRDAVQAEGIACYKLFIQGLLDITDNIVGGKIVAPLQVVRHDQDDPYLVVAADKGTATFSDIANGLAIAHGFWLGDAFASGGSVGYDHKGMGITARGAWESVKRHFRAMGRDSQSEDFTCVGIGDMSGDVFGNGMLLSPYIKLVAAFDHRHIFLDPDPDCARSLAERQRLFDLPRSSWADYDTTLISAGGGVFPRTAKTIAVSPQVQAVLGIQAATLSPNELMHAILMAPVDLLYNGGIGTYVKASTETHLQAGDRSNDAIRVNGNELRCKVVGEGGNLGFTQLGRIEFARNGGRINTDAIDNSAGVDCSDHEVNIKILLGLVVAEGEMTEKQRNKLLAEMTDEVGLLVLQDNYYQTQALSVAGREAVALVDGEGRLIRWLERAGRLNRPLEFLPSETEIAERKALGQGLTSPERAVLLAYSKMWLYEELLASDIPEDALVANLLVDYFPEPLQQRHADAMTRHPLRREILATHLTNLLVNRIGATFVHRLMEETDARPADIVRACLHARDVFGLSDLWARIDKLDNHVDDAVQARMFGALSRLLERGTLWFIRFLRGGGTVEPGATRFVDAARWLTPQLATLLPEEASNQLAERAAALTEAGVDEDLALRVAASDIAAAALDIAEVAGTCQRSLGAVAAVYFALDTEMNFAWLRERTLSLPSDTHWDLLARTTTLEDLGRLKRALTTSVLAQSADGEEAPSMIERWRGHRQVALERYAQMLTDQRASGVSGAAALSMLSVAVREIGLLERA